MLELVRHAERIQIVRSGIALVDGTSRGDRIEGRLTGENGVRGDILLEGVCGEDAFHLSGRGSVCVGPIALADATVNVELSGVSVTWTIAWPDGPAIGSFEMGDVPGTWRGRLDGRETLRCLMTRVEVLRTSITFDVESADGPPVGAALAVLEGRNIEVPLVARWWSGLDGDWSAIRAAALAAVAACLREELVKSEVRFAKVSSYGDGGAARERPGPASRDVAALELSPEIGAPRAASSMAPGGYLPSRSAAVDRSNPRTASPDRGYIGAPRVPATGAGYLGPMPRHTVTARKVSGGAYLPVSAQVPGYLPSVGARHLRPSPTGRAVSDMEAAVTQREPAAQTYVDVEGIGYALLRCKDLLQALDVARAHDVGCRAG